MLKRTLLGALAAGTLTLAASPAWAATINGTAGPDRLRGTVEADEIFARAGNDLVRARAGGDLVNAGRGDDRVFGNNGPDVIFGRAGADYLDPGNGADRVWGGLGNDQVRLSGDGDPDYVNCGAGSQDVVWWFRGDGPDAADVIVNCEIRLAIG